MSDYGGRLIRDTEPTVTSTTASGIWTLEEALKYKKAGTWPTKAVPDPNFNQTVLLLHGDGTNGAQNNTFLDSSTNNFTITRNGNTTQGTFSPFSLAAGQWSNYFDGSGDWLQLANNAAFDLGTGDCTIEAWVYTNSLAATQAVFSVFPASGTISGYSLLIATSGFLVLDSYVSGTNQQVVASNNAITTNTWVHVAYTRSGGTNRLFINGNLCTTSTNNVTQNLNSGGNTPKVGYQGFSGFLFPFNGYISNARIVKGRAVYTSAFTPPTAPLGATSGGTNPPQGTETSLLTCQSNRFVDNSSNAFAITRNGDVRVTPFSPFAPTAEYDAGTNGGSGYFDGTGDYLTVASNSAFDLGTGNFTIECWFYYGANPPTGGGYDYLWGIGAGNTNGLGLYIQDGIPKIWNGGPSAVLTTTGSIIASTWYHIAVVRNSSTLTVYLNGSSIGSVSLTSNLTGGGSVGFNIARWINASDVNEFPGYISNFRIVKGTAVYTGAFTPPTLPISTSGSTSASAYPSTTNVDTTFSSSNTSLLCNFTNAGIFDNTGKNNLETVGNAQIDTTTKKFGTGSMEFDGTGDRLVFPSTPDLQLGTGNFTIEGWVYRADTNVRGVFQLSGTAGGLQPNTTTNLALGSDTGAVWRIYANNSAYNSATTWSINTWYHFALVRNSGTTTLYINGTSVISQADTVNYTGQNLCVGGFYDTTFLMNGYIDDLRITKGVARYTANFTAPTAPFLDQ